MCMCEGVWVNYISWVKGIDGIILSTIVYCEIFCKKLKKTTRPWWLIMSVRAEKSCERMWGWGKGALSELTGTNNGILFPWP